MANQTAPAIVYRFGQGVYINLTNRCPNLCVFCIKTKWKMDFHGNNLNLQGGEPSAREVLAALEKELRRAPFREVVFCGYGEPTLRLDELLFVAQTLKGWRAQSKFPPFHIRLNTNGLGSRIHHKNIVPLLRNVLDEVNVSVNAESEEVWQKLVRPQQAYLDGFEDVWDFLQDCVEAGFDKVTASCVDKTGCNPAAVEARAKQCGAAFYLRSFLDDPNT